MAKNVHTTTIMYVEMESWFCGRNSTDQAGDVSVWTGNTCFIDGLTVLPHAAFIVIFAVALLLLACTIGRRTSKKDYLLCYPGHTVRWLVGIGSLIILVAAIGEGVLTDQTYREWHGSQYTTQPHYYVPSGAAFIAVFLSLVYYHHMELWQLPSMSIPLLGYWMLALTGEGLRLANLRYQDQLDVHVLRFDVTMIMLIAYSILILNEMNLIRIKGFGKGSLAHIDLQNNNMHFMNDYVNLVSQATYWWANWVFIKGYKTPLEHTDLGDIPEKYQAHYNHKRIKEAFRREQDRALGTGCTPSMSRVYIDTFGYSILRAAMLQLISNLTTVVGPLCIGALTSYIVTIQYPVESEQPKPHYVTFSEFFATGFVLVVTMFIVLIVGVCFRATQVHIVYMESGKVRAALQTMVYEKALRLATFTTTAGKMTMGEITNHMSTDISNVMYMIQTVNYIWSAPFQIVVILVLLYFQIGLSALLGASLFLVFLPIQVKVAAILANRQKAMLRCSDQRLKKTNELLQGIKLLKMYAWEQLYCQAIETARRDEMGHILYINFCRITSVSITLGSPILVTMVAFATYSPLTKESLTPQITFSSLALFNQIALPLFLIPISLSSLVGSIVSSKRLMNFFLAPEFEGNHGLSLEWNEKQHSPKKKVPTEASVVWFKQPGLVSNTSTDTACENSVCISTQTYDTEEQGLLRNHVSLKELSGSNSASAKHTDQDQDTAVKITNGNFEWDPESDSAILSDINAEIPAGKLTMVIGQVGSGKSSLLAAILGEMTTRLGGVRINEVNGRIAYAAQKPWLLNASLKENILFSAELDNKRYKAVLEACALQPDIDILPAGDKTEIGEKGINLSGGQKQRVSVARAMYADRDIIILDDPLSALDVHVGRQLFEEGIMKLLVNQNKTVILVSHQLQYLSRADLIIEMKNGRIAAMGDLNDVIKADPEMYEEIKQVAAVEWDDGHAESAEEERHKLHQGISSISAENEQKDGQLVEKEEMVRGSVSYKTYLYLMRNISWGLVALVIIAVAMQTAFAVSTNFWLSSWSEAGLSNQSGTSSAEYMGGYAGLSVAAIVTQLLATAAVILSFMVAAKRIHLHMLRNIIRAPLRFFDTTLVGRVLNRFSNDTQIIDSRISIVFNGFNVSIMQCIASVVVVGIIIPYFLIFVIPIALIYYFLQIYYLATSRELQRLDSTSKSPVFTYFSESLGGLSTIRAYRCESIFYNTILTRIDKNTTAYLYFQVGARWLILRLEFLGAVFVLLATGSTLIGALLFGIDPSLVGLSATYSLQMSSYLHYLMVNRAEVETQMNAVERIKHYADVETEDFEGTEPSSGWPMKGDIRIDNISVRYAVGLDNVLRNISVHMKAGEKVGICGRTGSGKSSLTLALLRVIDICEGQILIDDVNIKSVPLAYLRSQISIIPQDPVLFTGPIRANLDPERQMSDDELWHALEISQLKDVVSQLNGGLDSVVTEGGENFSLGQRQLFCLARAFLRKSRILIMDEATASVDMETDKILQTIVAEAFADRTVLTIAHRIATIRSSDKIMVLDGGHVAEFGSPGELLADENGMFSALTRGQ